MAVAFSPGTDFEDVVDGLEAVTLDRRGSEDNVSITSAFRTAVSTIEAAASDGKLTDEDTRWHFPVAEVPIANPPRMGDWVEANGDRYQILGFRLDTMSTRWRCVTRNLRVVYHLGDTFVIQQAVFAKGTAGAAGATYHVWKAGVRGRIQETEAEVENLDGVERTAKTWQVLLENDYEIDHQHRLKDRKGNLYDIELTVSKGVIGQPMQIEVSEWRS